MTVKAAHLALVDATTVAIKQIALATSLASNGLTNTTAGKITAIANANAHAVPSVGAAEGTFAEDSVFARGVLQSAAGLGGPGSLHSDNLLNQGTILVEADAEATAYGEAEAFAAADGVKQIAAHASDASVALVNAQGAHISVAAHATAIDTGIVTMTEFGGASRASAIARAVAVGVNRPQSLLILPTTS